MIFKDSVFTLTADFSTESQKGAERKEGCSTSPKTQRQQNLQVLGCGTVSRVTTCDTEISYWC